MGLKSHADAEGFSSELNAYLKYLVNGNGREDLSGRWLEEITDKARARDYWSKLIKNERAMNMNDVPVLAKAFGLDPFDFVRQAEVLANGGEPEIPNVGPHAEDYEISKDPGSEYGLAAKKRPEPGK
jgi:hypothetical protein